MGAPNSKKAMQELAVGAPNSKKAMQELAVAALTFMKDRQILAVLASHVVSAIAAGDRRREGAEAAVELTVLRSAPSLWLDVVASIFGSMEEVTCLQQDLYVAVAASPGFDIRRQCVGLSFP